MALLPSFFVLQSGGRYLSLTENIPAAPNLPSGFLKFNEEQIWSPRTKFAAEPAANGGKLFHIRSLYNNKYLVTVQIGSNSWIVASAKKPEEDTSKGASCTLFEPYSLPDDDQTKTTARLRHVGTGISATHHSLLNDGRADDHEDTHQGVLLSTTKSSNFIVTDSRTVLALPSQLAFRSEDLNGNYLGSIWLYGKHMYQNLEPGLDIGDPRVAKELLPTSDGNYRIKNLYNNRLWIQEDSWIKADVDSDQSRNSVFSFVKIDDNVVGVRNMGTNGFCGAYTEDRSINCLNARYASLSKQTRLIVEEPVLAREIKDVEYRLSDSRIHDEQIVEMNFATGKNDTPNDNNMTFEFSTKDTRTTSWTNSYSFKLGVKESFQVSFIPLIVTGTIELSFEAGYDREWGESVTTEFERKTSYSVVVPPFKTVKVTLLATKGACDVPFSYTQRDLLPSGNWVEYKKDDGLFTGINSYNFQYLSQEVTI